MSKGSAPRRKANYEDYSDNYDRIFGKDNFKRKRAFEEKAKLSESMESDDYEYGDPHEEDKNI